MDKERARRLLVALLQLAFSGERAAAYAYQGHASSVADPVEKKRIREIEQDEWHHRDLVGGMLRELGAAPSRRREIQSIVIGKTISFICHVTGWLIPMYGAGKLERGNIVEYEHAAAYARDAGHPEYVDCLLMMAEVEWEHEKYFREKVEGHFLAGVIPIWSKPPAKEKIRLTFAEQPV